MSESYQPPFHMTEEITNLIVEIGQYVGSITTYETLHQNPVLRRESRIKTIYSSLAIEQNTLSLDQAVMSSPENAFWVRRRTSGKCKMPMRPMNGFQRLIHTV